ncbi:hypothetical protein [Allomesorhizobium alhagi]|jgi:hypothetical protein|uniref:Uncharacterized protein n=1 Tax=Mesorhizobium alhagi CCNWXJ12-2 TaxID=1107882 RepID=H0HKF5_9HYPH|nr:hypothetical protein [Mesorhizobium alhagi]EHK58653.1 hypothetical protein MAXJ12_03053 [Mesorhizobium alhagi CCNWXJ12-2]
MKMPAASRPRFQQRALANVPLNAFGQIPLRNKPAGVQFGPERQLWHRDEETQMRALCRRSQPGA